MSFINTNVVDHPGVLNLKSGLRAGVDIGGTFTDLIILDDATGRYRIGKVLTTPDDPSRAVEEVLSNNLELFGIEANHLQHLIHGTTLVTNAMIERKGCPTALFTTEGFRDALEIGKESRYDLYDLKLENPNPLVPRYLRFDIPQRTLADGSPLLPLDEAYVKRLAKELAEQGIEAIAVCFLHSFTNPDDERLARSLIQEVAPEMRVSLSSDVVPEIREYSRTSTTVANVYVQSLVERYLRKLADRLATLGFDGSFYLMMSNGGIATRETSCHFPVRLLESGPAAGALAAADYGSKAGLPDLISFDMGGTTAKICVINDGQPCLTHEFEVDRVYRFKKGSGLPIRLPVIELIEIGTGGGSIARVDSLGLLKVGPDSSSADPGPACYNRGGTLPTVTDANLILGYLDPDFFLGGRMSLSLKKSRKAIEEKIAQPLGITVEAAAWGIHKIANENMVNAARVHALERGRDPRRFPMFAFGGAGPVHAFSIARSLGSPQLLVPLGAGVISTVGFLTAPLTFDFVRSWPVSLHDLDWMKANELLGEMEDQGRNLLANSGVSSEQMCHQRSVDMRFIGQGHEISVPLPPGSLNESAMAEIKSRFAKAYEALYGRSGPPVETEIIHWRVVSSGPKPQALLKESNHKEEYTNVIKGQRNIWVPSRENFESVPVYNRYALNSGFEFAGPAVIEERESTVIINESCHCTVDEQANLRVDLRK